MLFSNEDKNYIDSVFDEIHSSMTRHIYVYSKDLSSIPDNTNPNYNPVYDNTEDVSFPNTDVLQKRTMSARILYGDRQLENNLGHNSVTNIPVSKGLVRIKVTIEDFEILKNSTKVELDGDLFTLETDPSMIGPFTPKYVKVYLKRE